jgi:hypothetical protein
MILLWNGKNPIYFGVIRSKVMVTYYKYNFWQQGRFCMITLVLYIGSLPNLATWCLVKIQYTELKLCGNDPVVKNSIYSNGDLDLWPNDPKIVEKEELYLF